MKDGHWQKANRSKYLTIADAGGKLNKKTWGTNKEENRTKGKREIILEIGQWTSFLSFLTSPSSLSLYPPQAVMLSNQLEQISIFSFLLSVCLSSCLHFFGHSPPPFFLISIPVSTSLLPIVLSTSASPSWAVNIKEALSWHPAYTCLPNCFLCSQLHAV